MHKLERPKNVNSRVAYTTLKGSTEEGPKPATSVKLICAVQLPAYHSAAVQLPAYHSAAIPVQLYLYLYSFVYLYLYSFVLP